MLSVKDCILFEWKNVSLPIHREEELDYALNHVSYYDSPFSSSYEERKAYYGEDWYHYQGEELETLCTLPDAFTAEQKTALLQEYRDKMEYGNRILTKLERLKLPIKPILNHFLCITLEQAEHQMKLFGYREILDLHQCTEEQQRLLLYCYSIRVKEKETKEANEFLSFLEEKYGSEVVALAIKQYKVEECLLQLKHQLYKMPTLKNNL
jgi:hypothetical protein